MASAAIARFGSMRTGVAAATRGLRTISAVSNSAQRAPAPLAWATGKRCMSTKFLETHEYVRKEGDVGVIGITSHATKALGDIVFIDLPSVGDKFEAGETFGSVESVKAASDVYAPVAGEVVEINEKAAGKTKMVNDDPMGAGWFIKMKLEGDLPDCLMDEAAYEKHIENDH